MIKTSTNDMLNLGFDSEDLFRYGNEEYNEEPSQNVIDNLLRFSRSLEVRSSKLVGQIENVTN